MTVHKKYLPFIMPRVTFGHRRSLDGLAKLNKEFVMKKSLLLSLLVVALSISAFADSSNSPSDGQPAPTTMSCSVRYDGAEGKTIVATGNTAVSSRLVPASHGQLAYVTHSGGPIDVPFAWNGMNYTLSAFAAGNLNISVKDSSGKKLGTAIGSAINDQFAVLQDLPSPLDGVQFICSIL